MRQVSSHRPIIDLKNNESLYSSHRKVEQEVLKLKMNKLKILCICVCGGERGGGG